MWTFRWRNGTAVGKRAFFQKSTSATSLGMPLVISESLKGNQMGWEARLCEIIVTGALKTEILPQSDFRGCAQCMWNMFHLQKMHGGESFSIVCFVSQYPFYYCSFYDRTIINNDKIHFWTIRVWMSCLLVTLLIVSKVTNSPGLVLRNVHLGWESESATHLQSQTNLLHRGGGAKKSFMVVLCTYLY